MDRFIDIGPAILVAIGVVFIGFVLARSRNRVHVADSILQEERERIAYEAAPKCVCGELATHPMPVLRRSRGSWLRKLFAAPPSYRREVDTLGKPVFCEPHAHAADSFMDRFIFGVRQEYAMLNAKIATDAAGFEQEALLKLVTDSLTDQQKRARRLPVPIRSLPASNGTQDG